MAKKQKQLKRVLVCSGREFSMKELKESCKEKKVDLNSIYFETELDYMGCFYESDTPSIVLKAYGYQKLTQTP